ncbi:DUF397 domain-containing protein [Micromonospora sp. DT62]|uniref:DUF397 domain-containing protein n=1 Tax=Micromonospora sp. DT62 TaxID=3416521 RepID=UPI003CF1E468
MFRRRPACRCPPWRCSRSRCFRWRCLPGVVGVRDSKDPAGPALTFAPAAWRAFVAELAERA